MKKQIVVDIEVLDEEHCDNKCDLLPLCKNKTWGLLKIKNGFRSVDFGFLRTAECKKREVVCSENKSVQQK